LYYFNTGIILYHVQPLWSMLDYTYTLYYEMCVLQNYLR
jgi:hypothetical protein